MCTSDEIGTTATNKTSNTEHGTTKSSNTSRDHQRRLQKGPPPKQQQANGRNKQSKRKKKQRRKRSKTQPEHVNLKKFTQGQNRHYIRIKYYFIFTYYYKMKILFSSFCYQIIIIFLVYINFCNRN